MRICLFELHPETLHPLTLTRPLFELRCGLTTLADKIFRHFQASDRAAFVRPALVDVAALDHPDLKLNCDRWLGDQVTVLVNSRWLPPSQRAAIEADSHVALVGEDVAYVKLSAEQLRFVTAANLADHVEHWKNTLPRREAGGSLIHHAWDLVEANGLQIIQDFAAMQPREPSAVVSHLALVGPRNQVWVHPSAHIDPMVVVDTSAGPVVIDRGARIDAFTRLEGPCYVGAGSHVFGAKIRKGVSIGPGCRVGGEVEASILHAHVNKYHEGFLGHSYVGAWVNLAAGTHTSDLRCDYGEVSMTVAGQHTPTGQRKVGSFIGDHSRTGLGVLLNTGSTIGAFAQVLPASGFAPRFIPSYTHWSGGTLIETPNLDEAFATAQIVMERRGKSFAAAHRDLFDKIFSETAMERRIALRSWEQKHLRRSA